MTTADTRLWLNTGRLVVALVLAGVAAWHRHQKRRTEVLAQDWPTVDGWIQCGKIDSAGNPPRCIVTLTYSYHVDEYQCGTYTREFREWPDADAFIQQMKDKHVPISYNPAKPDESVLEDSAIDQQTALVPQLG